MSTYGSRKKKIHCFKFCFAELGNGYWWYFTRSRNSRFWWPSSNYWRRTSISIQGKRIGLHTLGFLEFSWSIYSVQVWQLLFGMVSILNFHIQCKFAEAPFYFAETVSQMSPEFCSVSFMPSSIKIMKCSLALFINCTITFGKKYEQKRPWIVFQTPLLKETRTVTLLKPDLQKRSQLIIFEVSSNVHFWTWMIPW